MIHLPQNPFINQQVLMFLNIFFLHGFNHFKNIIKQRFC